MSGFEGLQFTGWGLKEYVIRPLSMDRSTRGPEVCAEDIRWLHGGRCYVVQELRARIWSSSE